MKKVKIILDVIMIIIMILLMNTKSTGLQIHEVMGIGIFIIFAIHKVLNLKWIKSIGKNLFNKNMNTKFKVQFILDIVLFVFITANVISGIFISKCILTNITIGNIRIVTIVHKFFAWWSLILISIHIGFHWKSFVNFFITKFTVLKENIIIKFALKLFYITIAILGIISLFKKVVYTNLIPINTDDRNMKEHHRDFEDMDNKEFSDSDKFDKEERFKNRPADAEYTNGEKRNKGKNRSFDNNQENNDDEKKNSGDDNDKAQANALIDNTTGGTPTLNEYLGKFTCSGCGKRCLLSNPQCGTGRSYQTEKTREYNELYGSSESSSIQENNIDSSDKNLETDNNINEITKANINGISVIDYISIMGLLIGGTYYTIELVDKNKKPKNLK